ncbi:MAG: FimV/HubP family polar landmark protein [Caldimonas sp.]
MGAEIDPENPMFKPGGAPASASSTSEMVEPLGASTMPHSIMPSISKFATTQANFVPPEVALGELDLDLDDPESGRPSTRGALDSSRGYLAESTRPVERFEPTAHDLPPVQLPEVKKAPLPDRNAPLAFDLSGFSLDLDKPAPDVSPIDTHSGNSIDLPLIGEESEAEMDPMSRKLELAEEFRQIGDKDGARDLLLEVLAKASGATRTKAQGMLDNLG